MQIKNCLFICSSTQLGLLMTSGRRKLLNQFPKARRRANLYSLTYIHLAWKKRNTRSRHSGILFFLTLDYK
uniref:Uncharacterized protein n=1 Tax=Anguilla anguilla TaxID=7936 RepID=A0A0E9TYW6_ANGAN